MKYIREILILVLLCITLVFMLQPHGMSSMGTMVMLGFFLVIFAAFVFFLFRERPRDEREELERAAISRFSYLVAAAVLVVGITVTELRHQHNPWLLGALVAMIAAKILGSLYFKMKE